MKIFSCQVCQNQVYFENTRCEQCSTPLGYDPQKHRLVSLKPLDDGVLTAVANSRQRWIPCANASYGACNWLIPVADQQTLCVACELNRTVPNLEDSENVFFWRRVEQARHRLIYGLMRLKLPLVPLSEDKETGLAFDTLEGPELDDASLPPVTTGHAEGVITINLAEANDALREKTRMDMAERYRTLLGHFRHEVGHYYWERLIRDHPDRLQQYRTLFGDEREDYQKALDRHYQNPRTDWQSEFVSQYATMHAWEDWAETWSHYLHMVDTLETAWAFRTRIDPRIPRRRGHRTHVNFNAYDSDDFDRFVEAWIPLTCALNSMNRSMGQKDVYPFVLPEKVLQKLAFVHRVVRARL